MATGRKVQLVRDGNVYTLDMHLAPEQEEEERKPPEEAEAPEAGLARPER